MVAVAMIGQLLHQRVVVVAAAKAQRGQSDAGGALLFDQINQGLLVDCTDVEIAIGREDHAIDAALDKTLARLGIGQLDARTAVGRAAGPQLFQRLFNARDLVARGGFEHHPRGAGVDHDAHPVICIQLARQQGQRTLQQRQFVLGMHRTGHIDQKHQVGRLELIRGNRRGAHRDAQQAGVRIPGIWPVLQVDRKGLVALGQRILIAEVVDQLLDAHRIRRRQAAVHQHAAHIGIGTGIDIQAEGGDRIFGNPLHRVVIDLRVLLAICRLQRGLQQGRRRPAEFLRRHHQGRGHAGDLVLLDSRPGAGRISCGIALGGAAVEPGQAAACDQRAAARGNQNRGDFHSDSFQPDGCLLIRIV